MWWAIGVGAAVVVIFLFAKLRAASHHVQLVNAAQNHLRVSFLQFNMFEREIDQRVWHDPYLLGYVQGSLALMIQFFGGKLSTVQKGMVTVNALKGLVGDRYGEVCDRMTTLHERRDPEFMRGMTHGSNVAILMANRPGPELLADPDVQQALREAPAAEKAMTAISGSIDSPYGAAGAVLMRNYMKRHQREAGL